LWITNPYILKLSALFARYLYQRKQLVLPGIGVFTIDPSVIIPETTDKNYSDFIQQIKYEQKPVPVADEDLINFIRTETGKIKPLAESDLDSFLSDGKILLNIGKPFHIDGIGSLMKTKSGVLEFTPGGPALQRLEGLYSDPNHEENTRKKTAYANEHAQSGGSRKLMVGLAMVLGLILIIWGGYSLYNRNTQTVIPADTAAIVPRDTGKANIILDSVQKIIDSTKTQLQQNLSAPGTYKFIIERTANKARALKRFQQLKENRSNIQMETSDSTLFSLYFSIPASARDTARIRDSLKTWYDRKQVFIEP
jgi:hypothetical protein